MSLDLGQTLEAEHVVTTMNAELWSRHSWAEGHTVPTSTYKALVDQYQSSDSHSALLQPPSRRLFSATADICLQCPNVASPWQLVSSESGGEKAVDGNGGAGIRDQSWWGRCAPSHSSVQCWGLQTSEAGFSWLWWESS